MPPLAVQVWLEATFQDWGPPERLRVDNGWPWGSGGDLPPALSLWLLGRGVGVIWNRAARPQQNGKVERFNGLLDQWGEPERCADWEAWGSRLAWLVPMQREHYPAVQGKSRLAACPELLSNPRRGAATGFEIGRVQAHLADGLWVREVNKQGQITLYHRNYGVGKKYAGRRVYVRFAAAENSWVIQDAEGVELRRHFAREITAAAIQSLQVSYVKPHERKERPNFLTFVAT